MQGLYRGASIIFEDDDAFQGFLQDNAQPFADPITQEDITFLTRHTETLALLRQAAARPTCRFTRDYPRPSFDMLIPENSDSSEMQQESLLYQPLSNINWRDTSGF